MRSRGILCWISQWLYFFIATLIFNKNIHVQFLKQYSSHFITRKVLLRERKRHTARRVASVRYAALSPDGRVPHPVLDSCPLSSPGQGVTPIQSCPGKGYPIQSRVPYGIPHPDLGLDLDGRYPSVPPSIPGMAVLPCPDLGWGTPHPDLGMGYPPPQYKLSSNLESNQGRHFHSDVS